MTPAHLYLHVPFCVRRCSYCDFAVTAMAQAPVDAWLDAIVGELTMRAHAAGWLLPLRLDTVYLGGGTPSLLGWDAMARLRERLAPLAAWDADAEWTCEANPESFTADVAREWADAGVTRISLGAQTFHEPALRWMGRLHGADGPARALSAARAAGIENVSLDLIFGLPARLDRDWSADLEQVLALAPEHISLYGLTAETATPLGRWVREGREQLADEERYRAEYLEAAERLTAAGFRHYEVSNFARSGLASRHNRAYWDGRAYVGLGPGAHSFLSPRRSWNVRDWLDYRLRVERSELPEDGAEEVTGEAASLERTWLGLRQDTGLPLTMLSERGRALAAAWAGQGWAEVNHAVRLTAEGWLLLDRLAVELASADEAEPDPAVARGRGGRRAALDVSDVA